eukprot:364788-Chlamydomonas_euryale.AAC.5
MLWPAEAIEAESSLKWLGKGLLCMDALGGVASRRQAELQAERVHPPLSRGQFCARRHVQLEQHREPAGPCPNLLTAQVRSRLPAGVVLVGLRPVTIGWA